MKTLHLDYSLTGENANRAIERGLAEADWYQCPVPRATMRKLLERRDGPALRDTLLWFALILGSGYATFALWGSWWAAIPYAVYAVLYASTSDSRWHEFQHQQRRQLLHLPAEPETAGGGLGGAPVF